MEPTTPTTTSLLEGVSNFRDLGGYRTASGGRVRTGVVYRSGSLHALAVDDLERLRAMDVRVAFDLRTAAEQRAEPLGADFVRHVSVPLERGTLTSERDFSSFGDGRSFLQTRYVEILLERAPAIGSVLHQLAHGDCIPGVIHCAAGKDRTGVVAAVLLLALGVDRETVLDDYELTSSHQSARRVQELSSKLSDLPADLAAGLLGTHRNAMAHALDELHRHHGTPVAYLTGAAGMQDADVEALRRRLID